MMIECRKCGFSGSSDIFKVYEKSENNLQKVRFFACPKCGSLELKFL